MAYACTCHFFCNFGLRLPRHSPRNPVIRCANSKLFLQKIQINLIFLNKVLHIPNIFCNFAAEFMCNIKNQNSKS